MDSVAKPERKLYPVNFYVGGEYLSAKERRRKKSIADADRFAAWILAGKPKPANKSKSRRKQPKRKRQQQTGVNCDLQLKYLPYREYLQSNWWKSKRHQKIKNAGGACEQCGARRRLQVHHLNYERLGREKDKDIQVLCGRCHEEEHHEEIQMREHLKAILAET
jgi:hypothetical protein